MQDAITYILTMNRSLSCCFSKYNSQCSGSKLAENAVNRGEVVPGKLCAQFHKQCCLPRCQLFAVKVKPVRNLDTAAIPTAYRFDGVGTHEDGYILPDGFSRNLKFKCQVAVLYRAALCTALPESLPAVLHNSCVHPLSVALWNKGYKVKGR